MSVFAEFSLPATALALGRAIAEDDGVTLELDRVVPSGSVSHYVWVDGGGHDAVVERLRASPDVASLDVIDTLPDRVLARVHWTDVESPLLDAVEESDAMLVEATGTAEGWTLGLRFADRDGLAAFYEACRRRFVSLELRELDESGLGTSEKYLGLTPAQYRTVAAAFEAGYFDVPRRTTIAALADELGVSDQAVSERLRRGLARYLAATLRADATETGDDADADA